MLTPPAVNTANMNGCKTAMNIEKIGKNHYKFLEENKPPDTKVDSMELIKETKEEENVSTDVSMQEDSDMGLEFTPTNGTQS